jgi:2-polyprenyl-6-methoxyphenol hydroxylase-like FAD-dependent oxidoreductase
MMLGFLLARAGVDVTVLEKHGDFLRDFRGDTIHPSTLEVMHELGLRDDFLRLPHQEIREIGADIGNDRLMIADFSHLPTHCKFIALMPQWDFLNFIADHAKAFSGFHLQLRTEATGLIEEAGRIVGLHATGPRGEVDIRAAVTVAADGRHSVLRRAAGLTIDDLGAPMDVLWFRLPRKETDRDTTFGHAATGRMMVLLDRGDYWQVAYLIAKGSHAMVQKAGLAAFRNSIATLLPFLADRVGELRSWDQVKLLTVTVDRLKRWWRPGLLCIGDAAHAMSPIGGVGINLAIQDAVAAANALAEPLRRGTVTDEVLAAIEHRRTFPTRVTQGMQIAVQNRIIDPLLAADGPVRAPWLLRALTAIPLVRRIPARLVGLGARPEHVQTPAAAPVD